MKYQNCQTIQGTFFPPVHVRSRNPQGRNYHIIFTIPRWSISPSCFALFLPLRLVFANRETWTRVSVPANRSNSHERPSIGGTRALIAFEVKYKSIDGAHAAHRCWQFDKALKFPGSRKNDQPILVAHVR